MKSTNDEILVVGAGPTGLMLACELALAGVRCRVLERRANEPNITRAFAVHARTLEVLDARGLAEPLVASGHPTTRLRPLPGAQMIDLKVLDTPFPMVLMVPQSGTEKLLGERARELGVPVVRGAEVIGLRQDAEGVQLDVRQDGQTRSEQARYVVGADGAHSVIRGLLGVDFVGRQYETHIMLADVKLAGAPGDALFARNNDEGLVVVVPFGDGYFRVIAWDLRNEHVPLEQPLTIDEMRDVFRRVAGTDFEMGEPRWMSRFLSERRQARHYRVGRVFLAGDAAHVHSPIGGLGMNTGLQDAINLGWKLGAAVHGWAPPWLLDSYERERHPVGASVLEQTDAMANMVLIRSRLRRALMPLIMRLVLRGKRIARLAGTGIVYPPISPHPHPLAGYRVREMPTAEGRLYELLRDGRFVLLDGTSGRAAAGRARPWAARVRAVGADTSAHHLPRVVLVRPDGYAAWAADRPQETEAALGEWCGPAMLPAPATA